MGNIFKNQMYQRVSQMEGQASDLPWLTKFLLQNPQFKQISHSIHHSKMTFVDRIFDSLNRAAF